MNFRKNYQNILQRSVACAPEERVWKKVHNTVRNDSQWQRESIRKKMTGALTGENTRFGDRRYPTYLRIQLYDLYRQRTSSVLLWDLWKLSFRSLYCGIAIHLGLWVSDGLIAWIHWLDSFCRCSSNQNPWLTVMYYRLSWGIWLYPVLKYPQFV